MLIAFLTATAVFAQSPFESHYPEACKARVQSPAMRLARTCSPLDRGSSGTFHEAHIADDSGANFCYNTFVLVEQKPGYPVQIHVLRDNSSGRLRATKYSASASDLPKSIDGNPVLSLKGFEGDCFFISEAKKSYCGGGWFGSSNNLQMTVELQPSGAQKLVTDRGDVKRFQERPLSGRDADPGAATELLLADVKTKILNFAEQVTTSKGKAFSTVNAYKACLDEFNAYTQNAKSKIDWSKEETAKIEEMNRHISSGKVIDKSQAGEESGTR